MARDEGEFLSQRLLSEACSRVRIERDAHAKSAIGCGLDVHCAVERIVQAQSLSQRTKSRAPGRIERFCARPSAVIEHLELHASIQTTTSHPNGPARGARPDSMT